MNPQLEDQPTTDPDATPKKPAGTYSPVTVHQEDTVGAIFLGLTTLVLLFAYLLSERRQRKLLSHPGAAS
jgi:hypothetical protein